MAFDTPQPAPLVMSDASTLSAAQARLSKINIERVRAALAEAREAETRLDSLRKQIAARTAAYETIAREWAGLKAEVVAGEKLQEVLAVADERRAALMDEYATLTVGVAWAKEGGATA
jgi:chromosome segregation ATPase